MENETGMIRCDVCGRRPRILEFYRRLWLREKRSYPFQDINGNRVERTVRYLCERCVERAQRHREVVMAKDSE